MSLQYTAIEYVLMRTKLNERMRSIILHTRVTENKSVYLKFGLRNWTEIFRRSK